MEEAVDILEVKVTGPKGPQKLKVDLADKETIKNYVRMAHGARKWQKERDDARQTLKKMEEELTGFKTDWQQLEQAFKADGIKGLVNLLEKSEDAYESFIENEIKSRKEWDALTPSQQEIIRQRNEIEKARKEQERLRSEYEGQLRSIADEKQATFQKHLEAQIHPAFDRYRFAGKLNDSDSERAFDELLWNRVMNKLDEVSESGELTQAMIDREFRAASQSISKHLKKQAEEAVNKTIAKKKESAVSKVQTVVKKNLSSANGAEAMRGKLKSGNLTEALSDFFKLGGKLN